MRIYRSPGCCCLGCRGAVHGTIIALRIFQEGLNLFHSLNLALLNSIAIQKSARTVQVRGSGKQQGGNGDTPAGHLEATG